MIVFSIVIVYVAYTICGGSAHSSLRCYENSLIYKFSSLNWLEKEEEKNKTKQAN